MNGTTMPTDADTEPRNSDFSLNDDQDALCVISASFFERESRSWQSHRHTIGAGAPTSNAR